MLAILIEKYFKHDPSLTLVCIIEGDANWSLCNDLSRRIAMTFGQTAKSSPRPRFMYDTNKKTGEHFLGVHTSEQMKHTMVQGVQFYMTFSKMCIAPDFETTSHLGSAGILAMLKKQMKQFMATPSKADPSRTLYSGKGEDGHMNDDLAMAMMLGIHWARQHMLGSIPAIPWDGAGRIF
jgi:hypothetical protein